MQCTAIFIRRYATVDRPTGKGGGKIFPVILKGEKVHFERGGSDPTWKLWSRRLEALLIVICTRVPHKFRSVPHYKCHQYSSFLKDVLDLQLFFLTFFSSVVYVATKNFVVFNRGKFHPTCLNRTAHRKMPSTLNGGIEEYHHGTDRKSMWCLYVSQW